MSITQLEPFVLDHGANVRSAGGAHVGLVRRWECTAVTDDLGDPVGLLTHAGLGVVVPLKCEHHNEGQDQAENAGNDTKHLG